MVKFFSLALLVTMFMIDNATAQGVVGDGETKVVTLATQKFILSEISSIGVDTFNASAVKMKGIRHEMTALYQPIPNCPTDKNVVCLMSMPPAPRQMTVIFREWEVANTPIKARIFNTCRRTIERAQPGSRVLIQGRVIEDVAGNRVVVRTIASCSVGTDPQ